MKSLFLILFIPLLLLSDSKPVNLQLKWNHQFQFAGFYMAKELGYYDDVGLDVAIHDGFKKDPYSAIESGKAQYAIASSSLVVESLKGHPFSAVAVIYQNSPMVWLTRRDSNINKPSDFIGKTVMYNAHNIDNLELMAIFTQEGVDTSKINFIPSSYSPQDLIEKKCDAYSAFRSNEPYALHKAGVAYHEIFPITYGLDFYGDILFTHSHYAKEHPQEVKAFRDASLKGWEYAFNHIQESAKLIQSKYAPQKSLEHLIFEANELKKQSLYPFVPLGHMNMGRFKHIANTFKKAHVVDDATLPEAFLFDPDTNMDIKKLKNIIFFATLVIVLMGLILWLSRQYSLKLKKDVAQQTLKLRQLNEHLEERIEARTHQLEESMHKAEIANASKSLFLANMSHEIRTPLNAIIGFINILKKDEKDATRNHYLDVIETSSHSLLGIINDILDLSKIEGGKLDIDLQNFNPQQLINDIIELFQAKAEEKKITLKKEYTSPIPTSLRSDPLRIKQILSNLLSNAIKFSPDYSQISFIISYHDTTLCIKVVDQGIGIAEDKQEAVFDAFIQAEHSTTRQYGGTGLGLNISKKLAQLLDGDISLTSEPYKGSTFELSVGATVVEALHEENCDECDAKFCTNAHVLVAEDNKTNQLLIQILLDDLELQHTIVNDGKEVLQALNEGTFDVILMDINMPNMDGVDATKAIRSTPSSYQEIPIIALTANAVKGDKERFMQVGMNAYVSKPIELPELIQALKTFIPKKEA
ncbi:MAG TPA: response regulator [Helicobacteraceae bacterium]|nr:response regulator [Helicobacteraceae bacterium]